VDEEQFAEWRGWLVSLGVPVKSSLRSVKYPREKASPNKLHAELYRRYLSE
jgi:hypothetical protein